MRNIFGRAGIAAFVAEFLGTGVLTLMFLSVKNSQIGVSFFVAAAVGLAVATMLLVVGGRNLGAYFNPALTLGLWSARRVATVPALLAVGAQLLGAWAAYGLFTYIVNTSLPNPHASYNSRTLVIEAVGTGILAFGWSAAMYRVVDRGLSAATAGLSNFVGMVSVSVLAIAYLNPAIALGARSWVWGSYVVGPLLGAVVGANLYALLFAAQETADASVAAAGAASVPAASSRSRSTVKKPAAKRKTSRGRK